MMIKTSFGCTVCVAAVLAFTTACGNKTPVQHRTEPAKSPVISGAPDRVVFATAWSSLPDPSAAGLEAAQAALKGLGCPAKGLVFYTYYQSPDFVPDEATQATAVKADAAAEQAVAKAVANAAHGVPTIGCRARSLCNGGTLLKNAVAVLAIGGQQATVAAAAVPILDNRKESGQKVADAMKGVKNLALILALAEMRLSFETKKGVSVEDFIRGVLENSPEGVSLFGGNSMPDDMAASDLAGAQFFNGQALKGHVVALGIGGPLRILAKHNNEFASCGNPIQVTETRDKWILTLDGQPAMDVYRKVRGMKPDEKLTSDWQHPIGVVVGDGKVYLRMILNWVGQDGKDKDGKASDLPKGSLCFVAPVEKGSRIFILGGGADAQAIIDSARKGIEELTAEVSKTGVKPALCLLSDCCARGMRLRTFGKSGNDEVTEAILPALPAQTPLFGFYAWGELGRIQGEYQKLTHQYQQHTFVATMIAFE